MSDDAYLVEGERRAGELGNRKKPLTRRYRPTVVCGYDPGLKDESLQR